MEKTYQRLSFRKIIRTIGTLGVPIVFALWLLISQAQAQSISLISDEEAEQLLEGIIRPLFDAANLSFNRNEIHIVNDPTLNAFVSDGNNLFIHTGTIINAASLNELAGVIAHETGHIQGGHILRQKLKNQSLQEVSLVSAILAGTAAAVTGRGDVAMAAIMGSQSSMLNHYLHYRTEEERSADEAALNLLNKTSQSPQGMLTFMKKIAQQNQLSGREENPYFRTHPITVERIAFFEQAVSKNNYPTNNKYDEAFKRVKAKLFAYLSTPQQTLQKYPFNDTSISALYAQSIAMFKQLKFEQALKITKRLINQEPDNPFFYELEAQIYMETGKIKSAIKNYKKALSLLPNSALLQISYAQSLMEDNPDKQQAKEAINLLNKALISRPSAFAWMLLARAYDEEGNQAGANYAAAEYSYRIGQPKTAQEQLKTARSFAPSKQIALKIEDLDNRLRQIIDEE